MNYSETKKEAKRIERLLNQRARKLDERTELYSHAVDIHGGNTLYIKVSSGGMPAIFTRFSHVDKLALQWEANQYSGKCNFLGLEIPLFNSLLQDIGIIKGTN